MGSTAGSEPTGVPHGIVSTRRMGRGPREVILLLCPVWVNWFDVSTRTTSPTGGDCHSPWAVWAGPNVHTAAKSYCSIAVTVAAAHYFPV